MRPLSYRPLSYRVFLRCFCTALTAAALMAPAAAVAAGRGESDCSTVVRGSRATASCHNPYPETDRVRLHITCERWWDIGSDSAPVEIGPAGRATLTDRCWKEIRAVWITHEPV